jgi:hypothetical protein
MNGSPAGSSKPRIEEHTGGASITTVEQLAGKLPGYLLLTVMRHEMGDPFPSMVERDSGSALSVLRGCYLTPYAQLLFTANQALLDGLLLDATFKIIPRAVASIMTLSIYNVGIPVAMAFGPIEDSTLYETFHRVFADVFGIDLDHYHVVSDQGLALRSVCAAHANQQFICLRHLLLTLKRKLFSDEVGQLVRCRVQDDYARLCALYEPIFTQAAESDRRLLSRTLAKVGLAFESGRIQQLDRCRWCAVSMMERVEYRLPTTSNALESTHGHANECTPRRNEFLQAVMRVGTMMIRKTLSFRQALKHNFATMVRKARRRAEFIDRATMEAEIAQYGTTLEGCRCGETIHMSAMYRQACPCSHQYALGAVKPATPDIDLVLSDATDGLTVRIERVERARASHSPHGQVQQWERIAVEHIRRFSHATKKKEEIQTYVHEHLEVSEGFAMGFPVSLYRLISDGIRAFSA